MLIVRWFCAVCLAMLSITATISAANKGKSNFSCVFTAVVYYLWCVVVPLVSALILVLVQ